jgi:hypothetical protein
MDAMFQSLGYNCLDFCSSWGQSGPIKAGGSLESATDRLIARTSFVRRLISFISSTSSTNNNDEMTAKLVFLLDDDCFVLYKRQVVVRSYRTTSDKQETILLLTYTGFI